jgi:hypothetical protein
VSKRHQSSRRKAYGRRQHEVHERSHRRHVEDGLEFDLDPFTPDPSAAREAGVFDVTLRGSRMRFALGD